MTATAHRLSVYALHQLDPSADRIAFWILQDYKITVRDTLIFGCFGIDHQVIGIGIGRKDLIQPGILGTDASSDADVLETEDNHVKLSRDVIGIENRPGIADGAGVSFPFHFT